MALYHKGDVKNVLQFFSLSSESLGVVKGLWLNWEVFGDVRSLITHDFRKVRKKSFSLLFMKSKSRTFNVIKYSVIHSYLCITMGLKFILREHTIAWSMQNMLTNLITGYIEKKRGQLGLFSFWLFDTICYLTNLLTNFTSNMDQAYYSVKIECSFLKM